METNTHTNLEITVPNVSDSEANADFAINYGGNYFINVSTIAPKAISSPSINYHAPELPTPHQVMVFNMPDGQYKITWNKPALPPKINSS